MGLQVKNVTDPEFARYGCVLSGYDFGELLAAMEKTPLPEGVIYTPSDEELEKLPVFEELTRRFGGGLPIQLGYCNGHNHKLNAMEYHRSSELNVAATDLILLLGARQDMEADGTYDTAKVEAFLVPAGTGIEVYATTLHYAPCSVGQAGFRCVVGLPKDTNLDLDQKPEPEAAGEDRLLFARNKWLVAHQESGLEADGAFIGLKGENVEIGK